MCLKLDILVVKSCLQILSIFKHFVVSVFTTQCFLISTAILWLKIRHLLDRLVVIDGLKYSADPRLIDSMIHQNLALLLITMGSQLRGMSLSSSVGGSAVS